MDATSPPRPHLRGVILAAAGALCFVPDATLVRLADADDLQVVFWRSVFIGVALTGVVAVRHRRSTARAYRTIGAVGLFVSLLWGVGLVLFVYSINHTAVANTLVILATAPLFAAGLSRLLIGELTRSRTWLAMAAAAAGVVLTFASALRIGGLSGNLAAVALAAVLGLNLTLIRRAGTIDMLPAISIAGFVGALLALPAAWPIGISARDVVVIGAMGLVLVPAALTLLTLAPRYLPAAEVTLLMTLETVLGPLLAWAVIGEQPPPFAAAGGTIVVATLVLHSLVGLRRPRQDRATVPVRP